MYRDDLKCAGSPQFRSRTSPKLGTVICFSIRIIANFRLKFWIYTKFYNLWFVRIMQPCLRSKIENRLASNQLLSKSNIVKDDALGHWISEYSFFLIHKKFSKLKIWKCVYNWNIKKHHINLLSLKMCFLIMLLGIKV